MLTGLLGLAIKWILPSLGTAIGGYLVALLRTQLAKAGLALTAEQDAQLRALVQAVIRRVEEEATTAPAPVPSPLKREAAVDAIVTATGVDRATATRLVHEELPRVRPTIRTGTINPALPGGGRR